MVSGKGVGMTPCKHCPKWEKCNAPLCPLDPDWQKTRHLKGESVCHWLRMYAKQPVEGRFQGILRDEMAEQVISVYDSVIVPYGALRTALERASKTGSRLDNLRVAA